MELSSAVGSPGPFILTIKSIINGHFGVSRPINTEPEPQGKLLAPMVALLLTSSPVWAYVNHN